MSGLDRTALACAIIAFGAAALSTTGLSTNLFQQAPPPETIYASADQVSVIDGETLRLGLTVVGLDDVSAPLRGEACAAGPDCGSRATDALASLVRDRPVECRLGTRDRLRRVLARCDAAGNDINRDMVATGWARAASPALADAERQARAHNRGIWVAGSQR